MKLNIINRMRKQLWLLPILLLSMGVAQAQTKVDLTISYDISTQKTDIYNVFGSLFELEYGVIGNADLMEEYVGEIETATESYTAVINALLPSLLQVSDVKVGGSDWVGTIEVKGIVFNGGKSVFDLFKRPTAKPAVGETVNLELIEGAAFWTVVKSLTLNNGDGDYIVENGKFADYEYAITSGEQVEANSITLTVATPKKVYVSAKNMVATYGDLYEGIPNYNYSELAYDDNLEVVLGVGKTFASYFYPEFIPVEGGAVKDEPSGNPCYLKFASGDYYINLYEKQQPLLSYNPGPQGVVVDNDNYLLYPVNHIINNNRADYLLDEDDIETGVLTVEKAELTLSIKARERKYDELNAVAMEVGAPAEATPKGINITAPADYNIQGLVGGDKLETLIVGYVGLTGVPTAKDGNGILHSTDKSDVGKYALGLNQADETAILAALSDFYIVNGNESGLYADTKYTKITGDFEVKKDNITITLYKFDELFYDAIVMQKIYGEKNPVGYFRLTKRAEVEGSPVPSPSPSYSFVEAAKNYVTASTDVKSGFQTAPIFGLKDDAGKLINPFDETTPVKLNKWNKAAPYVATVANIPTSTNYEFTIVDGSFQINKRPLEFIALEVNRDYSYADKDTLWTLERNKAKLQRGLTTFDEAKYNVNEDRPIQVRDYKLKELFSQPPTFIHSKKTADKTLDAGSYSDVVDFFVDLYEHFRLSWDQNYELSFDILFQQDRRLLGKEEIHHYKNMAVNVAKIPLEISFEKIVVPYGKKIANFNLFKNQAFIKYKGFVLNQSGESLDVNEANNRIKDLKFFDPKLVMSLDDKEEYFNEILPVGIYELTGIQDINRTSTNYEITIVEKNMWVEVVQSENFAIEWEPVTDLYLTDEKKQTVRLLNDGATVTPKYDFTFTSSDPESVEIVRQAGSDFWLKVKDVPQDGTVDITVSYNDDKNMKVTPVTKTFKVNRALNDIDVTITIGDTEFVYDGKPHVAEWEGKATKNDEKYIFNATYDGELEMPVDAGTYGFQIYAIKETRNKVTGHLEYSHPVVVRKERLVIRPIEIVVEAKDQTIQYGEEVKAAEWAITEGTFLPGDYFPQGDAPKVAIKEPVNGVGTYTLEVTGGNADSNYKIIRRNGTLTITKKALTIEAVSRTIAYGSELPTFELKYTGFAAGENADNLNYVYEAVLASKYTTDKGVVGEYDIAVVSTGDIEPNYTVTKTPGILTVERAATKLEWAMDSYNVEIGDVVTLVVTSNHAESAIVIKDNGVQMNAELDELKDGYELKGMSRGVIDLTASQAESKNYKAGTKVQKFTIIDKITGIEAVESGKVSIYPTLVENNITVQSEVRIESVYVIDLTGKVQKTIQAPESQIDLSTLNRGHHVIVVNLEGGSTEMVRILKK